MNMNEKICKKQGNYRHAGVFHTIENPVYVSAPCKVFPLGSEDSRDFHILDISQSESAPVSCSLELRSRFFIENFQMSATLNPNDFVLLDGEPLQFASDIDFHSWTKQRSKLNPLKHFSLTLQSNFVAENDPTQLNSLRKIIHSVIFMK